MAYGQGQSRKCMLNMLEIRLCQFLLTFGKPSWDLGWWTLWFVQSFLRWINWRCRSPSQDGGVSSFAWHLYKLLHLPDVTGKLVLLFPSWSSNSLSRLIKGGDLQWAPSPARVIHWTCVQEDICTPAFRACQSWTRDGGVSGGGYVPVGLQELRTSACSQSTDCRPEGLST